MANFLQRLSDLLGGRSADPADVPPPIQVPVLIPSAGHERAAGPEPKVAREPQVATEPAVTREPAVPAG